MLDQLRPTAGAPRPLPPGDAAPAGVDRSFAGLDIIFPWAGTPAALEAALTDYAGTVPLRLASIAADTDAIDATGIPLWRCRFASGPASAAAEASTGAFLAGLPPHLRWVRAEKLLGGAIDRAHVAPAPA